MAYTLIVTGLLMILTGLHNTHRQFGSQIASDFTGPGNFTWWLLALGMIGGVGYVPKLRPVSTAFLTLIVLVLVLSANGLFPKLTQALQIGPVAPKTSASTSQSTGFLGMLSSGLVSQPAVKAAVANAGLPVNLGAGGDQAIVNSTSLWGG